MNGKLPRLKIHYSASICTGLSSILRFTTGAKYKIKIIGVIFDIMKLTNFTHDTFSLSHAPSLPPRKANFKHFCNNEPLSPARRCVRALVELSTQSFVRSPLRRSLVSQWIIAKLYKTILWQKLLLTTKYSAVIFELRAFTASEKWAEMWFLVFNLHAWYGFELVNFVDDPFNW